MATPRRNPGKTRRRTQGRAHSRGRGAVLRRHRRMRCSTAPSVRSTSAGATYDVISVPGVARNSDRDCHRSRCREGADASPMTAPSRWAASFAARPAHYEIVAGESARALIDLSVALRLPIGNGILTVETDEQAWARARPSGEDKGGGAAKAALALAALKRHLARSAAMMAVRRPPTNARPTVAARRGLRPCRRSIRWTSPEPD